MKGDRAERAAICANRIQSVNLETSHFGDPAAVNGAKLDVRENFIKNAFRRLLFIMDLVMF